MSTRSKVYALNARGEVIAAQYHHHDGYESNALPAIVGAFLAAGERGDAVAVLSALLHEWDGEWSAGHAPQIGSDDTTDLEYEYFITVKAKGCPIVEIRERGFIGGTRIGDDGMEHYWRHAPTTHRLDGMDAIAARMVEAVNEAAEVTAGTIWGGGYPAEVERVKDLAARAVDIAGAWQVIGALEEMAV